MQRLWHSVVWYHRGFQAAFAWTPFSFKSRSQRRWSLHTIQWEAQCSHLNELESLGLLEWDLICQPVWKDDIIMNYFMAQGSTDFSLLVNRFGGSYEGVVEVFVSCGHDVHYQLSPSDHRNLLRFAEISCYTSFPRYDNTYHFPYVRGVIRLEFHEYSISKVT